MKHRPPQRVNRAATRQQPEAGAGADATLIPDSWTPRRKWFAAAAGAIVLNVAASLGVDIGALVVGIAGEVGIEIDEAQVETGITTGVGALAGQYLWPEWQSLPDFVRSAVRKLTKPLRG